MATGIIIAVLIVVCVTAIKSYMNKLAHGCCGAGSDDVKAAEKKTDLSEYKYKTTVHIGGMSCKNCAERACMRKQTIKAASPRFIRLRPFPISLSVRL